MWKSVRLCTLKEEWRHRLFSKWGNALESQRDLGVLVQDSLKVNVQFQSAVRKANAMLAFMLRGENTRAGMYF